MSLIIAYQQNNELYLIGDTKISSPIDETLANNIGNNFLKIIIIHPQIAIAFAGGIEDAEAALKQINCNTDIDQIKSVLLSVHLNSFRDNFYSVEFILAIGRPSFELIEFKNGKQIICISSWIGSLKAFSLFQSFMIGNKRMIANQFKVAEPNTSENYIELSMEFHVENSILSSNENNKNYSDRYSKALNAMKHVIESGEVPEVGGFYTPVAYKDGEFHYIHYSTVFTSGQKIHLSNSHTATNISFGSPQVGAYAVTLLEFINPKKDKIATFHFLHGELGIIYERKNWSLPKPVLYPNHDSIDFSFVLKEKFQFVEPPIIPLGFSLDNFGINVEKHTNLGNFKIALKSCNWGIIKSKNDINVWKLYRSRANLFLKVKDYKAAINDFNFIFHTIPTNVNEQIYNSRGLAFAHLGKFHLAIKDFTEVLKLNPNRATTYYNRGLSYYNNALSNMSESLFKLANEDFQRAKELGYKNS